MQDLWTQLSSRAYFKESLQLRCRKEKMSDLKTNLYHLLKISSLFKSQVSFHLPKFLTTFFSHFLDFYISTIHKSLQVQLHRQIHLTFLSSFTQRFSTFLGVYLSFPLSHFKIYNYNCTIAILQLQITFYNGRNCHQLPCSVGYILILLITKFWRFWRL